MNDLEKRLFNFSVFTIKFLRKLPDTIEYKVIKYQLVKSATSSGANYEEAQAGSSKADFNNKTRIALREMRESCYWLKILNELFDPDSRPQEISELIHESIELKKILGSIVQKTRTQ